jgi:hypothetical protein
MVRSVIWVRIWAFTAESSAWRLSASSASSAAIRFTNRMASRRQVRNTVPSARER